MHFAYPPRKDSNAAAFKPRASSSRLPFIRRGRKRVLALGALFFFGIIYFLTRPSSRHRGANPWMAAHLKAAKEEGTGSTMPGVGDHKAPTAADGNPFGADFSAATENLASFGKAPTVVLVTVYDETNFHRAYLDTIRENRRQYAKKHGYGTFSPKVGYYNLNGSPLSWTKVVAMRHALTLFPESTYFWFLDQNAFVMNMDKSIEGDIMAPAKIDAAMLKDFPVVPPDSIIKTFGHLKGQDVDFLLTQDYDGLSTSSFIVRNGEWARFFFETWFDPLYRSYNFQKAETHALEHIVQWHPTLLSKMALVPQRTINAYSKVEHGAKYETGDLSVRVVSCIRTSSAVCENEAAPFIQLWRGSDKQQQAAS
ncbi:mannan polymerase II complex MNN11 subunit [Sporothrix brasiliensis 5110]|uniref:Mannan polymerase II complex MNN11 subunit n=1 Tax=Sporothrix brasiliensis 5110 TaxID=1398154 RepID=A0A0C2J6W0_9PEZI|nr:mannan polymerase II complex MNN11 subunit [Sporothrix brasiliensis 5110]KIH94710.1 mannan polymerase II complex MNN11 subunit [Sporothrix brasiliensis 5110]